MCLHNNVLAFLLVVLYIHETSVSQGHVDKSQRHELVISSHHCCSIVFSHVQRLQGRVICPACLYVALWKYIHNVNGSLFCITELNVQSTYMHSDAQVRGRLDMQACMYIFIHMHNQAYMHRII